MIGGIFKAIIIVIGILILIPLLLLLGAWIIGIISVLFSAGADAVLTVVFALITIACLAYIIAG